MATRALKTRLKRIERDTSGRACPECGFAPGGRCELRLSMEGEPEEEQLPADHCPTCGRAQVLRLEFDTRLDELL